MHESGFNFIVGIGRSGTTLLMSMLNAHPSIQATPEVNFFNFFYHSWKNKTNFSESDFLAIEVYVKSFDKKKKVTGFSWDMNLFKDKILKARKIDFQIIYSIFYSCFSYSNSYKVISHNFDKNPINTLMLQEIIDTLPNAKFIYLVRDPRANYLSRKEKAKKRPANIYLDPQRWRIYNESAWSVIERNKDRFFILKYEDLVTKPEQKIKELAQFFNFEYHPSIFQFHENVKNTSFKEVIENPLETEKKDFVKYEKLSKPINTDRLDVWKEKLSENEIQICSGICAGIANKFGYDIDVQNYKTDSIGYFKGLCRAKINYHKNMSIFKAPLKLKLMRI